MTIEQLIAVLTSCATLINSLILWPLFKGMKTRIEKLESR